jgi:hypothetical protein
MSEHLSRIAPVEIKNYHKISPIFWLNNMTSDYSDLQEIERGIFQFKIFLSGFSVDL